MNYTHIAKKDEQKPGEPPPILCNNISGVFLAFSESDKESVTTIEFAIQHKLSEPFYPLCPACVQKFKNRLTIITDEHTPAREYSPRDFIMTLFQDAHAAGHIITIDKPYSAYFQRPRFFILAARGKEQVELLTYGLRYILPEHPMVKAIRTHGHNANTLRLQDPLKEADTTRKVQVIAFDEWTSLHPVSMLVVAVGRRCVDLVKENLLTLLDAEGNEPAELETSEPKELTTDV